jgi:hypothetical protein
MLAALKEFGAWFLDALLWVPLKTWELLLEGLGTLAEWCIDLVGAFLGPVEQALSGLPEGVAWGFALFEVPAGLTMVISAYGVRFLIRRIPLIG